MSTSHLESMLVSMNSEPVRRPTVLKFVGPIAVLLAGVSAGLHLVTYYMAYMFRFHYRPEPPHIPIFDGHYQEIAWAAFLTGAVAFILLLGHREYTPFTFAQKVGLFLLLPTVIDVIRVAMLAYDYS